MKHVHLLIVASALVAVPGMAQSSEKAAATTVATGTVASTTVAAGTVDAAPVMVKPNAMIVSADGRRIGHVDHVRSVNGTPMFASVVVAGQFVNVPVSSLTAKDGGFVSSLKATDLIKR